ncbi:MAG: M56 family metallopeptidase [Polaribacter sp.]
MIIYLLKSAGCLSLLLFFYHFILEKEKMHSFNRFYLLGSILFSFLAPLTTITVDTVSEPILVTESYTEPITNNNSFVPLEIIETPFDYSQLIIGIYILISCVFLFRFGMNLFKIVRKIKLSEKVNYKNSTLVLVADKILPHTFWNYIFINKNEYKNGKIEEELFTHELTHVTQKHTLDVLLIELLQAVFWINPLFIFLKKAIQLNHEFLADETVINQHKNTFQYQHLLVNKAAWNNEYYLASNLNYSLTKKRLEMMTTQSSHTKILLKKLAVIPLLAGFIFLFAERVQAQEKIETIYEQPESVQKARLETEIYKEYYYRNGFITTKDKNGRKISKKYSELTKEEKKNVLPPPPLKTKKKVPNKKLIDDLKDAKKYAVWIDGKVVKNELLNNYKNSDFSNFFVSFVHKNARSKRFPQEYQASLYTNKYFKDEKKKSIEKFNEYLEKKHKNDIIVIEEEATIETIKEKIYTPKGEEIHTGFKDINNSKFYFVTINKTTKYYNKDGKVANRFGKVISNKKAKASTIIPGNYVTKTFFNNKVFCDFIDDKPNRKIDDVIESYKEFKSISTIDYIKKHKDNNVLYYYNNKSIKYDKALDLIKNNRPIEILTQTIKGKKVIKLTKKKTKKENKLAPIIEQKSSKQSIRERKLNIEKLNSLKLKYLKKDSLKFNKGWFITIDNQKYHYTFDKNERIARYYKNGVFINLDIVKEYNKKHTTLENLKKNGKHYVFKSETDKKEIDREFSDLGGMYFRMSRADKNKVSHPKNPIKPYVRLRKGNKIWFKKLNELTDEDKLLLPPPPPNPNATKEEILKAKKAYKAWKKRTGNDFIIPPPPPPRNHLDQVIEMAKKGAKFYYEKEPIDSDKAIALLKKNKKLSIHSESTNNSNYKVWISKTPIKN